MTDELVQIAPSKFCSPEPLLATIIWFLKFSSNDFISLWKMLLGRHVFYCFQISWFCTTLGLRRCKKEFIVMCRRTGIIRDLECVRRELELFSWMENVVEGVCWGRSWQDKWFQLVAVTEWIHSSWAYLEIPYLAYLFILL